MTAKLMGIQGYTACSPDCGETICAGDFGCEWAESCCLHPDGAE